MRGDDDESYTMDSEDDEDGYFKDKDISIGVRQLRKMEVQVLTQNDATTSTVQIEVNM